MEVKLTDNNFEQEVLKADKLVFVDFWASWCGPCMAVGPIISEIAEEYKEKLKVGKLNVDENPSTAKMYDIRSIPTMIIFKDGVVSERFVGALSKEEIKKKIDANLD